MKPIVPCDTNLENGVLGALIQYPEIYPKIRDYITTDDVFYQDKAKMLWNKIKSMLYKKEFIDLTTVASNLKDLLTFLPLKSFFAHLANLLPTSKTFSFSHLILLPPASVQ